jgi:hypothetical protein
MTDVPALLGDILTHINTISCIVSSYQLNSERLKNARPDIVSSYHLQSERLKNARLEQLASDVHKLKKLAENLDFAETKVHLELLFIELEYFIQARKCWFYSTVDLSVRDTSDCREIA